MQLISPEEQIPVIGRSVIVKARDRFHVGYLRVRGGWADDADSSPIYGVQGWAPLPEPEPDTMAMLFPNERVRIDGRSMTT